MRSYREAPWRLLALLALALPGAVAEGADLVWLETEHFAAHGGWTPDAQFLDQMGSPYLMAVGLGEPVDDASTTVRPPRAGRYRLWVRTRDWVPDHHPGRFRILMGGNALEHVFGQSGKRGWHWEDGGTVDLAGPVEFRLRDLTGYYGRCDVIVLAADPDWTPPDEKEPLAALRRQHGGVSREVKEAGDYEVVVVGGGLAGCMAAVTSSRLGCRTVLVQNRPVLGGNASVEILVPPVGVWPHSGTDPLDPRETGLIGEIRTAGNQRGDEAKVYSSRLLRLVQAEPNLKLFLHTHATGVEMARAEKGDAAAARRIAAVLAQDVRTGQRLRLAGEVFIDCTGDGAIGAAAGAELRVGKEPRAMYGESLAPEEASPHTMGNSLKYVSQPTGKVQPFETPAWAFRFRTPEDIPPGRYPRLGGDIGWQWMLELGGNRNTIAEAEEIRDDLLRLIYGLWGYVKNHSPKLKEKAADHKLVWVAHVAGKRESRRLIGDYVLNENDIARQTLFPDRIAFGGWGVDDHHSDGFFYRRWPASAKPRHMLHKGRIHSIPFRALYSQNVDNLLMAGRNISASHVAMAATRVMMTCAIVGQAAGTGAALGVEHGTTPRGVCREHLGQLQQQLLKDGAWLVDLPNRDPRDLARSAEATASSERRLEGGERMAARCVVNGFARAAGGRTNAWAPDASAALPQWVELHWDKPRTFNVIHVTFQTTRQAPERFAVQALVQSKTSEVWKALAEVSGCRHRRYVLGLDRTTSTRVRVVLLETSGNRPGVCEVRVYDEPEDVVETARRALANMQRPDDPPDLPWDDRLDGVSGVDPRKLPGIVLDDTQGEARGPWIESTFTQHYIGRGYRHDGNAGKGARWIRFAPQVPQPGRYAIRLAYAAHQNRASKVPVTVRTSAGTRTLTIDQRKKPPIDGLFCSLGTFTLRAGRGVSIEVSNRGTDGYVTADAVQLVPVDEE